MPVLGQPRSFHRSFLFGIEIDSFLSANFQKCSELTWEVAENKHYEGGTLIPHKSPGRVEFKDITLERGATFNREMYEWAKSVVDAAANAGLVDEFYKRNLDIVQRDRDGSTLRRWRVYGAWPKTFTAGEWNNDSDDIVIEKMTLSYDFFEEVPPV
jgi:phage tail-like protein